MSDLLKRSGISQIRNDICESSYRIWRSREGLQQKSDGGCQIRERISRIREAIKRIRDAIRQSEKRSASEKERRIFIQSAIFVSEVV